MCLQVEYISHKTGIISSKPGWMLHCNSLFWKHSGPLITFQTVVCSSVVPVAMNRLISWQTFCTTVLNHQNPLCAGFIMRFTVRSQPVSKVNLRRLTFCCMLQFNATFPSDNCHPGERTRWRQQATPWEDYFIVIITFLWLVKGGPKKKSCYRFAAMGHKTVYRLSLWFIVLPGKVSPLQSFVLFFLLKKFVQK